MNETADRYEQVTEWAALDSIAVYAERKRLANSGDGYAYFVEEDHSQPKTRYRIVRRVRRTPRVCRADEH
jgi:hypothetical protein